jgi:hypothetical protein
MTAPHLAYDLTVRLDYGQFCLWGGASDEGDLDYMALLDQAIAGPGIAGDGHSVVVLSPHQNNFDMAMRVEVWRDRPPEDGDGWEEVAEAGLAVRGGVLRYASPTVADAECPVPDGGYAVRICGRGFVNRGWPGSTTPGDVWRVQLWPAPPDPTCRRLKAWAPPGT